MPTAKPDTNEVYSVLRARPQEEQDENPIYEETRSAVQRAVGEGFLTLNAAIALRDWFESHPELTTSTPGTGTLRALRLMTAPNGWTSEAERDLLRYLTAHYLECDETDALHAVQDLYATPHPLFSDLYADIFDQAPESFDIAGKLVAFTGSFAYGSRRVCFDAARSKQATPSEVRQFTDFLFVADKHVQSRVMSSKIFMAVVCRTRGGRPRIYTEKDWQHVRKTTT